MAYSDYGTGRADVASDIETYIQPKAVEWMTNQLCGDVAADIGGIPKKKGDYIEFCRILQHAKDTTELTEGTQPNAAKIFTMDIKAQVKQFGHRMQLPLLPLLTAEHLDLVDKGGKLLADWGANTADYLIMSMLAANAYRIRADGDGNFQKNATTTSDGNAGGTTLIASSLIGMADPSGGTVTITGIDTAAVSREAIYQTRPISSFNSGTGAITVSAAFDAQIKSGCTIHVCVGTGIVSTDALTTEVFSRAMTRLALNKAQRFSGQPGQNLPPKGGGYFIVYISPHTNYSFQQDTTWVELGINQVQEQLLTGIVKWMGSKVYGTTQPWREDVDGTENEAAGVVHVVNFLGTEAYGISGLSGAGGKPPYGFFVTYQTAKDLGQSVLVYDEIGCNLLFARIPKNDLWNVAVLVGAPTTL